MNQDNTNILTRMKSALATAQDGLEHMDSGDEEGARMAFELIVSGLSTAPPAWTCASCQPDHDEPDVDSCRNCNGIDVTA